MPGTASISSLFDTSILEDPTVLPAAVPKTDTAPDLGRGGEVQGCYVTLVDPNAASSVDFQKVVGGVGVPVSMSPGAVTVPIGNATYFNGAAGAMWIPVGTTIASNTFAAGDLLQLTVGAGAVADTFVGVWFQTSSATPTPLTVTVIP